MFAWGYFENVEEAEGHLRLGVTGDLTFLASPTDERLFLAAVCPPLRDKKAFLSDRESAYMAAISTLPEVGDLIAGTSPVGPIRVMTSWRSYFRQPAGQGWALLGDAGNFKDPSPAQGMSDALRQAERLATAIVAGLNRNGNIESELKHWWDWRDQDALPMHWLAADMGAVGRPSPLADQLTRDLAKGDVAVEQLLLLFNRELLPSEVFSSRRIARAASHILMHRPREMPAMGREVLHSIRTKFRRSRQRRGAAGDRAKAWPIS